MKKINTDGAKINLPINKKLRFKNRKKQPTHRLPFVSLGAEMGINYWDVPKTGGYIGGFGMPSTITSCFLISFSRDTIGFLSETKKRRILFLQISIVLPDPANGSITMSNGFVYR